MFVTERTNMHVDTTAQIILAISLGLAANVRAAAQFVREWRSPLPTRLDDERPTVPRVQYRPFRWIRWTGSQCD
jgi:hypothetical protein